MKEIGGWQVNDELVGKLECNPDGFGKDHEGVIYSWVFDEYIQGNPRSAIYVRKQSRIGIRHEIVRIFKPGQDILQHLRLETKKIINEFEEIDR